MVFFIILGIVEAAVLVYIAIFSRAHFVKHFFGIILVALIGAAFSTAGNGNASIADYLKGASFFAIIPALIIGFAERSAHKLKRNNEKLQIQNLPNEASKK